MVRRGVASAACLLVHRTSAFGPPCSRVFGQISWRGRMLQQALEQRPRPLVPATHDDRRASASETMGSTTSTTDVFALDFDAECHQDVTRGPLRFFETTGGTGVICNSQGESSRSGFKAVKRLWPDLVSRLLEDQGRQENDDAPGWMLDKMRELRPVVETGYENILLVRLLIEEELGLTLYVSDNLLHTWGPAFRDELTARYGLNKDQLVEAFGQARDEWIETDFQSWLGVNSFYPGVREAISACAGEVYVVTTKQQRFASALLEHAGVRMPLDRIFGLGTGPKANVLADLVAKHSGCRFRFLEDRVETLEIVSSDKRLQDVRLYLCDWGFNTMDQRARGRDNPRVQVISTDDILEVLAPQARAPACGDR